MTSTVSTEPTTKRPKAKHYWAIDSRGKKHTRSTISRTYTHCVVRHIKARPADEWSGWQERPAYSASEWSGSQVLAERAASVWQGKPYVESVEILTAQQE